MIDRPQQLGIVGQWLNAWVPGTDDLVGVDSITKHVALVLEDDVQVSPRFYAWVKPLIERYAVRQHHSRLFGIGLEAVKAPVGVTVTQPHGSLDTHKLLGARHLYLYQQLCSWGTILFPSVWTEFLDWFHNQPANATPCVPTLESNRWWARNPGSVWTAWFHRFAYERGVYGLYVNFPGARGAALSNNSREAGEHFGAVATAAAQASVLVEAGPPHVQQLPDLADLDVFDLHFRQLRSSHGMLAYRNGVLARLSRQEQCTIIDRFVATQKSP